MYIDVSQRLGHNKTSMIYDKYIFKFQQGKIRAHRYEADLLRHRADSVRAKSDSECILGLQSRETYGLPKSSHYLEQLKQAENKQKEALLVDHKAEEVSYKW